MSNFFVTSNEVLQKHFSTLIGGVQGERNHQTNKDFEIKLLKVSNLFVILQYPNLTHLFAVVICMLYTRK
jgi:hypothetical protein